MNRPERRQAAKRKTEPVSLHSDALAEHYGIEVETVCNTPSTTSKD